DLHWAGGNFSSSDYDSTNGVTTNFVSNYNQEVVIDITLLVQSMYQNEVNDGFVIYASSSSNFRPSENGTVGLHPVLEVTYTYIGVTVSISATDASAAEPSNTGTYTVTRAGSTTGTLAVNYTVSGTATNGTDYTSLSGTVTIPDGQASTTITLTPTNDSTAESTETAILTLASGTGYTIGSPNAATVNLTDNDSTVTITATDSAAAEPSNTGTFTVTRSGYTGADLTVNYSKSGAATNGTDYNSIGTTVTIPSGQTTATVTVTPIDDTTTESTETVILTLASGTDYTVGSPNAATVNITDNDSSSFGITGVSGTVNAGQTVTISGNVFGSGPDAVVFDNFESGTVDTPINYATGDSATVGDWNNANGKVTYTDDYSISGDQAFRADMGTSTYRNEAIRNLPAGTNELFATWWVRMPEVFPGINSADGSNWKHVWILGANQSTTVDYIYIGIGANNQVVDDVEIAVCPIIRYTGWTVGNGSFQSGDWLRMTFYVKGGTTDGTYTLTVLNERTGQTGSWTGTGKTWGGGSGSPD
ncbi:MAG: hypothetical protein EHM48_09875, partial [Planctomycetaceae bacterium]